MKRLLHLVCLLLVAALLPAALLVSRGLPADPHSHVERKYAGWSGVLRAWVCAGWECPGGFLRWLNACATEFEKAHDGVYIEFTPVSVEELRAIGADGVRPPELVLFSPGVLANPSPLIEIEAPGALRQELRSIGGGYAYPVAMGGYIWAYNRALTGGAPSLGDAFAVPIDDAARSYSSAAVAMLSAVPGEVSPEAETPDAGIDLGLPANAPAESEDAGLVLAEDALTRFIAGELPAVAVTQADLGRLVRLRDAGNGPDWDCAASGRVCYTDQLLLAGIVNQSGGEAAERLALAREFGASLLAEEAQAKLADVGAFSVTGEGIYDGFSAYAALDGALNGRALLVPSSAWREAPSCGDLLRALASGALDAEAALAGLWARLR